MSKELYAGAVQSAVTEIDISELFSRAGHVVSMRLMTDPHTGQHRWFAIVELASRTKVKRAVGALGRAVSGVRPLDRLLRYTLLLKGIALALLVMLLCGSALRETPAVPAGTIATVVPESELDREIRSLMEKGIGLQERRRQVAAIAATFARRTEPQRARWLAALCYLKTLGTPFMPLDIAEIALAETGSFGLSGEAVSPKGAMGVWQLMPHRAVSHGYTAEEMKNDEKCAEAAVRELTGKLKMARGNLAKAKKLYCGAGPEADAYVEKIREFKREILRELGRMTALGEEAGGRRG